MVRRRSLRAALAGTAIALASTTLAVGPAHAGDPDLDGPQARAARSTVERAAVTSRKAARKRAERATPLAVTIETLSPSAIPARGKIRVAGTVTNTDSVVWRSVNVYSFVSAEPMTTQVELAAAVQVDESESVGQRITDFGNYYSIDAIQPGASRSFTFTVDRDVLDTYIVGTPGVYWFGVHALGERADEGRDELALADGRARTFLPLVPTRREGQEAVSVVIPLRRDISYAEDGSLDDLDEWIQTLGVGGRLRSLVELATTSGDRTVSWVVDPSLVDAVRQLAAGNPARSLDPNLEEGDPDGEDDSSDSPDALDDASEVASPTETPSEDPGGEEADDPVTAELPDDLDSETRDAAEAARAWLERLGAAMGPSDEVLAVPYGDTDVSAAARHDRDVYLRARNRSAGPLPGVGLETSPAVASPSGYLSREAVREIEQDDTILVNDKVFADPPSVASVAGRRLVVTSGGAADGGPSPGDPRGTIAMRQRILSEAAVRFLKPARSPLVVLLPHDWIPPMSSSFFSGLDVDWVELTSVQGATRDVTPEVVSPDDLKYPVRQNEFELDAANFTAAKALRAAGRSLQDLLTLNNLIGATVDDQSLSSTSYSARARPDSARASTDRSRAWIEDRLGLVDVEAPQAVTLSSINGSFPATITNELDQPVTVSLLTRVSDRKLTVATLDPIDIVADGRATVLLDARTDTAGIHDVTLLVTDKTGRPLGAADQLSIRSARVSNVIWLFLATGIGLLFGTIAFRLVRRVRAARR